MRSRLFSWLKIRGSLYLLGFLWNRKTKHKPWKSWFCEAMTADTLLLFEHAAGNQSWNSEWLSSSCFMNYSDRSGTGWLQALFPRADSSPPEWRCSMYSYSWRRNITEPFMNRSRYSYSWRSRTLDIFNLYLLTPRDACTHQGTCPCTSCTTRTSRPWARPPSPCPSTRRGPWSWGRTDTCHNWLRPPGIIYNERGQQGDAIAMLLYILCFFYLLCLSSDVKYKKNIKIHFILYSLDKNTK